MFLVILCNSFIESSFEIKLFATLVSSLIVMLLASLRCVPFPVWSFTIQRWNTYEERILYWPIYYCDYYHNTRSNTVILMLWDSGHDQNNMSPVTQEETGLHFSYLDLSEWQYK
jgi:hypothetical protein